MSKPGYRVKFTWKDGSEDIMYMDSAEEAHDMGSAYRRLYWPGTVERQVQLLNGDWIWNSCMHSFRIKVTSPGEPDDFLHVSQSELYSMIDAYGEDESIEPQIKPYRSEDWVSYERWAEMWRNAARR